MKILHKYLAREIVSSLCFAIAVFTFVLMAGKILPEFLKLLSKRVPPGTLLYHFTLLIPYLLTFSIPMAMLTATLLVFGKLSADNEITAIRASGVSLLTLISPAIVISILLVLVCLFVNCYMAPVCRATSRTMLLEVGLRDPTAVIEEGQATRAFPGYVLFAERKASNTLYQINIYVLDDRERPTQNLRAERAEISIDETNQKLTLNLYDVRGEIHDPDDPNNLDKIRPGIRAKKYPITIDVGEMIKQATKKRDYGDMTFFELLGAIRDLRDKGITPGSLWLEAHKRVAGSFACFAFLLIGIPLGIKTSRRETSINILISLGLVRSYYFCVILSETFKNKPQYFPEVILWGPNIVFEILGLILLWRVARA